VLLPTAPETVPRDSEGWEPVTGST
jgi:hypothetical protein